MFKIFMLGTVLTLVIIFSLLVSRHIYQTSLGVSELGKFVESFNPYKVNDCELIMKQQDLAYALCTMLDDGKIVLRDGKLECGVQLNGVEKCDVGEFNTIFNYGDYVGLIVDLSKMNIPYDSYYVCAYSNLPLYLTSYPKRYGSLKPKVVFESFECSNKFYRGEHHTYALSGFVLKKPGKYFVRLYAFDGGLPSGYNFKGNLDKGVVVFELEGEVK